MSLRVWLPLLGTLENKGLHMTNITDANLTVEADGKIGSCYSFNGTSSYIKLDKALFNNNTNEFSYACWFKPTSTNQSVCLFSNRTGVNSNGFTIFLFNSGNLLFDTGTRMTVAMPSAITANSWHHLVFTWRRSNGRKEVWVDGTLAISATQTELPTTASATCSFIGASQDTSTTINANYLKGCLNDVRIYDHVLSTSEIKELAKGLVCHYRLNDIVMPNILTGNVNDPSTWTLNQATATNDGGAMKVQITSDTGDRRLYRVVSNVWTPLRSTFTVSFDAKSEVNGTTVDVSRSNIVSDMISFPLSTEWKHYSGQIVNTAAVTDGTLSIRCLANGAIFWIKNVKLERNFIESFGNDTSFISDSSGHGNNGLIVNTLSIVNNAPRYNTAAHFSASGYITTTSPSYETKAISFWINSSAYPTGSDGFVVWADYKTGFGFGFSASGDVIVCANNDATLQKTVYVRSALTLNAWHHVVVQQQATGTDFEMYVDGVKQASSGRSSRWSHATDTLMLGGRSTTNLNWVGDLSDFRMYASRLSDADILELYHTNASVSSPNVMSAYEFDETESTSINNNGIVTTEQYFENDHLFNNLQKFSYKPSTGTNICLNGAIVDLSSFVGLGKPVTISIEFDISWNNWAWSSDGTNRLLVQGSNRKIATNTFAWEGTNYSCAPFSQFQSSMSGTSGTLHRSGTSTIPASWFETYNASYFGLRTDYSDGNGTATISNLKITLASDVVKFSANCISADTLIEQ